MDALISLFSLGMIAFVVFILYNRYRVDNLRQELFELRDELFIKAAKGEVSFDSPGYRFARILLNGMIRFAHRVSWSRFLLGMFLRKPGDFREVMNERSMALASLSKPERVLIVGCINQANTRVMLHLMTSPMLFVVLMPLLVMVLTKWATKIATCITQKWREEFDAFDGVAYVEGRPTKAGSVDKSLWIVSGHAGLGN